MISIASVSGADDIVSLGVLSDTFKDGNSRTQGHEAVLGQVGRVQDRERYGVRDDAPRKERIRLYTKKLSDLDVKEMISLLPDLQGVDLLELGAGVG